MENLHKFKLSAALTIPFKSDGYINIELLIEHAQNLLTRRCECVTLGGTTGEGTSLSNAEKIDALKAMIDAGIPSNKIGLGIFGTDIFETINFIKQGLALNINHLLITQPYYFKNPSAQGLTDWYDYIFTVIGDDLRDVILYNIPSCTSIDLPHETIKFLLEKYKDKIIGLKESSGDKAKTKRYQKAFPNLALYVGSETYLGGMVANGATGSISGCANFIPEIVYAIIENKKDNEAVQTLVKHIVSYPVTPAVKFFVAQQYKNQTWLNVRPPLEVLDSSTQKVLQNIYEQLSFN
ncbi:MAG: dihydrodipicolinate synthase family protein [Alphaproteobacteria bacterium]